MVALEGERVELDTDLSLLRTKQNVDRDTVNAFKLQELASMEKQLIAEIQKERHKIDELSQEVSPFPPPFVLNLPFYIQVLYLLHKQSLVAITS